jgi:hypothetical protein
MGIGLSSGYPRAQLDRLLRQLAPILELREPEIVQLDLDGLVFLGADRSSSCGRGVARSQLRCRPHE